MPDRRHALGLLASLPIARWPPTPPMTPREFDEDSIFKAAVAFFGNTAEGWAR